MKIEVVVDKDNTHFTYMHECDAVKDHSNIRDDVQGKLVLLKQREMPKKAECITTDVLYDTVAVYAVWTSWSKLPDNVERCERCARYRILNVNGYCHECVAHLNYEKKRER